MKTVTIRQTIEYDIQVPDDWNSTNGICDGHLYINPKIKDKIFSKHYADVYEIEDIYNVNDAEDKNYRRSVPIDLKTINTEIVDNND